MRENWFLLGDIHGESGPIEYFYNQNRDRLELDACKNSIILLGDVGCNFAITGNRDANFKKNLSRFPFTYILLRGNHEARVTDVVDKYPDKWTTKQKYNGTVYMETEFPSIEYLDDKPASYMFDGYRTLSIPGAYSIDKWVRLYNHWTWYENEQLTKEEMDYGRMLIEKEKTFDLVISHTCPIAYEPRDLFHTIVVQSQIDKTMEMYLGEIETTLNYRRWAWGHFHADRLYPWDGEKEKLMLFNENVVDLNKFMTMKKSDSFEDILA